MQFLTRMVFMVLLAITQIDALHAQSAAGSDSPLPSWIVLALRVEAEDKLVPATGIVVDASGLVLVSSEFAASKGELVVLDGGTDLGRHGRPAKLVRTSNVDGLALLMVENLKRSPPQLAAAPPAPGDSIRLLAYPPAQELGAGKPPLLLDRQYEADSAGRADIGKVALPNVSGALVNRCGQLIALSQSSGVPSMSATPPAHYLWTRALGQSLNTLNVRLSQAPCTAAPTPVSASADAIIRKVVADPPPPAPRKSAPKPTAPTNDQATAESADAATQIEEPSIAQPPPQPQPATPPSPKPVPAAIPLWQQPGTLLLAGVGVGLLILLILVWRLRKREVTQAEQLEPAVAPVTAELLLEARLSDGHTLRKAIPCVKGVYDAIVGRSDSDVEIPLDTISRRHARFVGRRDALMLVDLGSSNGTSVNRVPLVRHERIAVQVGDSIDLGGTEFTLIEA